MPVVLDEELLTRIKDCKSIDGLSVSAVQEALPRLMDTCLGPLFKKPSPKRPQEGRARAPVKTLFDAPPEEQLSADDQPWKTRETMDILSWCVETVDVKSAVEHQHRFYPPLLTLLGDFDVEYKMKGIPLLRKFLLNRLPPKAFSQTGLGPLVFQDLMACLTYHSHPRLISLALDLLIDLDSLLRANEDDLQGLEEILEDGILRGLVFAMDGKSDLIAAFLKGLEEILPRLGIQALAFTKSILVCLGDLLTFSVCPDTTRCTLSALRTTLRHCWARVPPHRGLILVSLASSWKIHSSRDDESILQDLNSAFDLLKRICEEDPGWNADVRLLVSTDPSLFGSLCGYPPSSK